MALRKQASQQFGTPDELSSILVEKIRKDEVKNALVVGLPYSGKHEFANSLREKMEKMSVVVLFDAVENPGDMYQNVAMALESSGIKIDMETIRKYITTSDSRAPAYQNGLKRALNSFSKIKDGRKLVLIMRDAEKAGEELENGIFNCPPENVAWVFVSSCHRKVLLPNAGRSAYADVRLSDSNTFYLKPFQGMPIESFCKLKKIVEKQVLENLMDFLSESSFTREGGQPSNFLEALLMKIVEKASISNWVEEALKKCGCFEVFDNAPGRELLASRMSGCELSESTEESATEWLKGQQRIGRRFEIEYDGEKDVLLISDCKIAKQKPHYKLNAKALDGRRINVVATLLRAFSKSNALNLDDAWCKSPEGGKWNEIFNDRALGGYAHFNSVELETKTENGKDTAWRRVREEPNLGGWSMHGPA